MDGEFHLGKFDMQGPTAAPALTAGPGIGWRIGAMRWLIHRCGRSPRRSSPVHHPARPDGQSERVTLPDKPDQEPAHTAH